MLTTSLVISFLRTYIPLPRAAVSRIETDKGPLEITEKWTRAVINIDNPEIIYTEEFASEVSRVLLKNKKVEVHCGDENFRNHFIADDLIDTVREKIQSQDGLKVKADKKIRGGYLGKKCSSIVVVFKWEKEHNPRRTSTTPLERFTDPVTDGNEQDETGGGTALCDYAPSVCDDNWMVTSSGGNRYLTAPTMEIVDSVLHHTDEIEQSIKYGGVVQIKRKEFLSGKVESEGMFVEANLDSGEAIINLAGRDEAYFEDIFIPLVIYFLQKGRAVLVDYDVNLKPEDIDRIENKVSENNAYRFISNQTDCLTTVEMRESNFGSEHVCVVLEPRFL